MINVAVLGHGTIGSGVVEVLQTNAAVSYTHLDVYKRQARRIYPR